MLTPLQQTIAVLRVGESPATNGLLTAQVALLATQYSGLDAMLPPYLIGVSLEDLYVRRGLAEMALGACKALVDLTTADQKDAFSQESARMLAIIVNLTAEIRVVGDMARSTGDIAVGLLTTVAPIGPPYVGGLDANDPILTGTAYSRRSYRRSLI